MFLLLATVFGYYLVANEKFMRMETINLGKGRYALFYNDWYDIESCLRRFEIRKNFILLEYGYIEFCDDPIQNEYKAIFAENRNLIGVLDYALDSPLIIMYDFKTDTCIDCGSSDEQTSDLFKRLKKENPELNDAWR